MAELADIFRVYDELNTHAEEVREHCLAKGERVSGTVELLRAGDRDKLLRRWGEEMAELCGVLDGSHDDPYIMEATQCFYWACLYAVSAGETWESLGFAQLRDQARFSRIDTPARLHNVVEQVVARGSEHVAPSKLFLLWHVADQLYRDQTSQEQQRSHQELAAYDLADMRKRWYLAPILDRVLATP